MSISFLLTSKIVFAVLVWKYLITSFPDSLAALDWGVSSATPSGKSFIYQKNIDEGMFSQPHVDKSHMF